jgi:4-amino-4-deoxy-L-arabinose transferase-like glycosyltransferase
MIVSGDWVTPRLNDLKYFEKPPLQYWATATAYTLFGEHQWTSRLWPALTGFCGLLLVWFAGTRLFGRAAGQYAALILGSSFLYVAIGHINTLDMGVTFFLTLGIVGLLLGQQANDTRTRRNWLYCAWAALGLAVLSKGLIGLVLPAAALVIYSAFQRDLTPWKRLNLVTGLLLFLLITAPWFILVMKANPEFFERFFIYEHYTRFSTKDLGRYQPWYYFIPILLAGMLPWTILMLDTLLRTWKGSAYIGKAFNPERFLLIWVVFIYAFFSVSGSKLPSYLLPIFPALALLMGKRLAEIRERVLLWQLAPVLLVPVVTLGFAPFTAQLAETPLKIEMFRDYATWAVVAALVLLFGLISGMVLLARRKKSLAVLVVALSSLIGVQIVLSGHNTVARWRSAYHIAESIRPYVKPDIPLYSVGTYEQTLPFYLKRTFTLVDYQNEMAFGIMQEPHRWIPDIASFAKIWDKQPAALAIMPVQLYPQLTKQGLAMKIIFEDTQHIVVVKP